MSQSIAVIGTGYVGLVTGVCFAASGNAVECVDIDQEKVERFSRGETIIYEPGLDMLLERALRERRITFTTDLVGAVLRSRIIFLCLPTPPDEDGSADLSYILGASEEVGRVLANAPDAGYKVIVDKSTVPVGTATLVEERIRSTAPDADFDVVSNPEFLREGLAVDDFLRPERVVVGTDAERAAEVMRDLYEPFLRSGNPLYIVSVRSAEVAKYAANSFVAMRISFINEMANFCERVGADVDEVRVAIGSDSRIGPKYLFPGIGYGGSCFPKDVKAILHTADEHGVQLEVIRAVEEVNHRQADVFVGKITGHYNGALAGRRFAVWGLAFKANTDDTRESPAFRVIDRLLEQGAEVVAYDPEATTGARRTYGDRITYATDMYAALNGAAALVVATEWNEFRSPDFARIASALAEPLIFDGRNLYDSDDLQKRGFTYYSVGRVPVGAGIRSGE